MRLAVAASVALLVVAGCGGTGTASRGELGDGGAAGDAGVTDAGATDGGPGDAGPGDAGVTDAGDGGASDAGFVSDLDGGPACATPDGDGACLPYTDCGGDHAPTPGYCPGLPADVLCCTPRPFYCDPTAFLDPNAGLTEAPGDPGCPDGMVRVGTFCIDRYEDALAGWSPFRHPPDPPPAALSLEGAIPQAYISGIQAGEACAAAGKRLCTDTEWLRACQGPSGLTYPYGDTRRPGVCNDHRAVHPAEQYFDSSDAWIWSHLGDPCLDQLPGSLAPAGSHSGCVTAEGAYDMMGNLHEWTADPNGTFRGGYYVDTVLNGNGCLYVTTAHNTAHWDYSTGFRCCADAQ